MHLCSFVILIHRFRRSRTGAMINMSKKLGVNTVSSTETEIVSTGERFPKCTWFRYFRGAQGSSLKEDILMQDNQSCILLQKNYPYSNGKGSKHIHIRYFFVVDKIRNKEVKIAYCPTAKMIANYSSKPSCSSFKGIQYKELKLRISKCIRNGIRKSWFNINYSMTSSMIYIKFKSQEYVENKNSHQSNWLILVRISHYVNIYASRDLGCLRDSARCGDRIGGQSVLNFSLLK